MSLLPVHFSSAEEVIDVSISGVDLELTSLSHLVICSLVILCLRRIFTRNSIKRRSGLLIILDLVKQLVPINSLPLLLLVQELLSNYLHELLETNIGTISTHKNSQPLLKPILINDCNQCWMTFDHQRRSIVTILKDLAHGLGEVLP